MLEVALEGVLSSTLSFGHSLAYSLQPRLCPDFTTSTLRPPTTSRPTRPPHFKNVSWYKLAVYRETFITTNTAAIERLVIYCQTAGVSAAHATHCATYCTPCQPLIRTFSGWIRTPPPTHGRHICTPPRLCRSRDTTIGHLQTCQRYSADLSLEITSIQPNHKHQIATHIQVF